MPVPLCLRGCRAIILLDLLIAKLRKNIHPSKLFVKKSGERGGAALCRSKASGVPSASDLISAKRIKRTVPPDCFFLFIRRSGGGALPKRIKRTVPQIPNQKSPNPRVSSNGSATTAIDHHCISSRTF